VYVINIIPNVYILLYIDVVVVISQKPVMVEHNTVEFGRISERSKTSIEDEAIPRNHILINES